MARIRRLSVKEKKFVKARVQGKTQAQAYVEAGYAPYSTKNATAVEAHHIDKRPHIQKAIDDALLAQGATPEWAVSQLMKVAKQDEEMGAKRLASMNILELHGYNKTDKPQLQLEIKNAQFFSKGRKYVENDGD